MQVGPCSDLRLRVLNDLLDQVLFEPCYDTLRTKQQLGYTVHSGTRLTYGTLGYAVVVVSAAYGAQEVEERIEAFLAQQEAALKVGTGWSCWRLQHGSCLCATHHVHGIAYCLAVYLIPHGAPEGLGCFQAVGCQAPRIAYMPWPTP
jgi:hypothetical protein